MCYNQHIESDTDSLPDLIDDSSDQENDNTSIIRAKWTIDGSKTLDEVIEKLNNFIKHVEDLKRDGWELTEVISDDYGIIKK